MLRGVNLGPCLEKWTVEYLRQKGSDKEVKIHVSTVPQMDFLRKNFVYKWAVSHKRTQKCRDKPPQLHWFIHRTLPFSEFVKRASERKHSDFFLCEVTNVETCFGCSTIVPTVIFSVASLQDESYYLRSLGEDVRKVQNRIIRMKTCCCFPAEALHGSVWLFNRNLLILADSFLTLLRIFTFHSSSPRSSFSPACSASALVVCSCGHTTMWAFFQF